MKQITITICTAVFLLSACNNNKKEDKSENDKDTTMQTRGKMDETTAMPDSATMMKNWQTYMTPGDMHALLAKSNGTWTSEVTMWEYPGGPATTSTGTAVNKMVMDGRYQETTNTGAMMGMPFEGHGITGYDNARKVFVSTWIDNMGTGIMNMEGTWDDASKSINFTGKGMDPMTMKETNYREIFKIVDDNTQMMEMYGPSPADGKEMKMMEIKFTRKK